MLSSSVRCYFANFDDQAPRQLSDNDSRHSLVARATRVSLHAWLGTAADDILIPIEVGGAISGQETSAVTGVTRCWSQCVQVHI